MEFSLRDDRSAIIELLTPAQDDPDFDKKLGTFAERFARIVAHGAAVSIPDNPMGRLRFGALEVMEHLGLAAPADRLLLHVNSFHTRENIDAFLDGAAAAGARHLLVVSGDGGPRLNRLDPSDIGAGGRAVTSVELLRYIRSRHPGAFRLGVAYNQYEPEEHENAKLERKLEAGAEFVITQPEIGDGGGLSRLVDTGMPVFVGAWMSRKIDLVYECVGISAPEANPYSPLGNLELLRRVYPGAGLYLSMVSYGSDWSALGLDTIRAARS